MAIIVCSKACLAAHNEIQGIINCLMPVKTITSYVKICVQLNMFAGQLNNRYFVSLLILLMLSFPFIMIFSILTNHCISLLYRHKCMYNIIVKYDEVPLLGDGLLKFSLIF